MRLTEFWSRMTEVFGEAYADSFAHDHVLSVLGRTVHEALAAGEYPKVVWRAVCVDVEVPSRLR